MPTFCVLVWDGASMKLFDRPISAISTTALIAVGIATISVPPAYASSDDGAGSWFGADAVTLRSFSVSEDSEDSIRSRLVSLDANAAVGAVVSSESLALAESGQRVVVPNTGDLSLTLFDGEQLTIDVSEVAVVQDAEGLDSAPVVEVIGSHPIDGGDLASAAFTFVPDEIGNYALFGGIDRGDQPRVEIAQQSNGVVRLEEVSEPGLPREETDAVLPDEALAPATAGEEPLAPAAGSISTIDLLVGYSSSIGTKAKAEITQRVTETNSALATSRAAVRLNLVSIAPVNYTQNPTTMGQDLDNLRLGSSGLGVLQDQREAIGADLITLIVPNQTPTECGRGYMTSAQGYRDYGLNVTAYACLSGYTLAHELGHNLGSDHDYAHSSKSNTPYNFSYGYQVAGKARDIMSYACPKNDCPRKLQFSNPEVKFIGYPTLPSGTATANAARSFTAMGPVIAEYRTATKITRLSGPDRYATAAAISKHGFTDPAKVSTLVIATGVNFPDALSAAPLATKVGGPLLLTAADALPPAITTEIKRLKPSKILIVGGTGAVSTSVETTLKDLVTTSGTVQRLSGTDRYATSLAIAKYAWPTTTTAFIATGADYPDALSAGAAAGKLGAPVVLVPGTASTAPTNTTSYLTSAGVKNIYIAGGTAIVSSGIQTNIAPGRTVKRYAGTDRFNTSTLIAKDHHTKGGRLYIASGMNFPDALAGAAVAGKANAPLILSAHSCVLKNITEVQLLINPTQVVLLGGAALLSEAIKQGQICA